MKPDNNKFNMFLWVFCVLGLSQQAFAAAKDHFLSQSLLTELSDPAYHTIDRDARTARHSVSWSDGGGRQLSLSYSTGQHADVDTFCLDNLPGLQQADVITGAPPELRFLLLQQTHAHFKTIHKCRTCYA